MEDNKNNQGAPSSDNTSALFVSARKKQLEQQEQDRIAAEKEAARLAAEEEVRRLEQEVADRRRKAEEDAKRVEEEAQERRRLAEEERVKEEKEARIRAIQQSQQAKTGGAAAPAPKVSVAMPTASATAASTAPAANKKSINELIQEITQDKKKLGIAIGAIAAVLILIIALAALGGGGSAGYENAYVMEGDPSNGYFNIYNDGTADYTDNAGEVFEVTWLTDGTYVELSFDDGTYITFAMIDEYTYQEINSGYYFYYYPAISG